MLCAEEGYSGFSIMSTNVREQHVFFLSWIDDDDGGKRSLFVVVSLRTKRYIVLEEGGAVCGFAFGFGLAEPLST